MHVKNFKDVKENPEPSQCNLKNATWWICSIFDETDDVVWAWERLFKDVVDSHISSSQVKIIRQ